MGGDFVSIPAEKQTELREIFGDDEYDAHFQIRRKMEVDLNKLTESQLMRIAEVVCDTPGAFSFDLRIVARDTYFAERILRDDFARRAVITEKRGLVVPPKSALKLGGSTNGSPSAHDSITPVISSASRVRR
jgi:hypothetical protein